MTGRELAEIILRYIESNKKFTGEGELQTRIDSIIQICQDVVDEW